MVAVVTPPGDPEVEVHLGGREQLMGGRPRVRRHGIGGWGSSRLISALVGNISGTSPPTARMQSSVSSSEKTWLTICSTGKAGGLHQPKGGVYGVVVAGVRSLTQISPHTSLSISMA